jgi:hypothetical protein
MELFQNYLSSKSFIEEREKTIQKRRTYLKLDTFITAMCIEERDGMLYLFYRQQII